MGAGHAGRLRDGLVRNSIKLRTHTLEDLTELKILLNHPMENGRNRDAATGELISAHYIEELRVFLNDQQIIGVDMAGSIAKNPYFSFRLKQCHPGDRISVQWIDNLGDSDQAEIGLKSD